MNSTRPDIDCARFSTGARRELSFFARGRASCCESRLGQNAGLRFRPGIHRGCHDSARQVWRGPEERSRYLRLLEDHRVNRDQECRLRRKGGGLLRVSLNSGTVPGADGQTLYIDGYIQNISARRRMEEALRKSEEKFSKVFLATPASSILSGLDDGDRIIEVNEAFEQLTGYSRREANGTAARETARLHDSPIHLLLTDIVRPGMRGTEVVGKFLVLRPRVPVLRISGYPEQFGAHLDAGWRSSSLRKCCTAGSGSCWRCDKARMSHGMLVRSARAAGRGAR